MSYVVAAPQAVAVAATDLASVGSAIDGANSAAAGPTVGALAAAADQVSVAVGEFFAGHAESYQAICAQMNAFHTQFVEAVHSAGNAYAAAESANASSIRGGVLDLLG
jgi:hypothetical protein